MLCQLTKQGKLKKSRTSKSSIPLRILMMTNCLTRSISWDRQMSLEGLVSRKMLRQRRVRATTVICQATKLSRLCPIKKNP